ncbi:transcription antitermination factor NusB [Clostridium cylindrosporum]|uniref:Transcription antitermination protein NusB n=1 Tax=Clostridium cylindrosporum DSM 605 TaxID=1121307 RepID=A0A0J8DAL7_CLOCY|nr:transcription antitermination factor NusB [Clostridium cylindrosporum]KMT21348.1 N utilization substance protein B [Clostridium cylindrosporum DSM 605]
MSRRKARELAMHLVYQLSLKNAVGQEIVENYYEAREIPVENECEFDTLKLSDNDLQYITSTVMLIEENIKEIDSYIEKYSRGWKVARIGRVELAIMRIAIFEMLNREDVPNASAINEAIELSKIYCEDKSRAFINGVLGNIQREIEA